MYIELYTRRPQVEKESILGDVVFEIELVKQVEINVDYILMLVKQLQESQGSNQDKEIKTTLVRAVDSSFSLRSKKDLIEQFVSSVNANTDIDKGWASFIMERKAAELEQIIEDEKLSVPAAHLYMEQAFREGQLQVTGTALTRVLPARNMFSAANEHTALKNRVLEKLQFFLERFTGL